jgi:hypothetical protein
VNFPNAKKWACFAAKVQTDLIALDASDTGAPISEHEVRRATLHTRHDMVLLVTHLTLLNGQIETLNHKAVTATRLLWAVLAVLVIIAIRV